MIIVHFLAFIGLLTCIFLGFTICDVLWDKFLHRAGVQERRRKLRKKMQRKKTVLFCTGTYATHTPSTPGYLGVSAFSDGRHGRECLKDLINITNELGITLIVQPHNIDEDRDWKKFIRKHSRKTLLASAKKDIWKLMSESDIIFFAHQSTAFREGLILGVPTYLMAYNDVVGRGSIVPVISNKAELKTMLKEAI